VPATFSAHRPPVEYIKIANIMRAYFSVVSDFFRRVLDVLPLATTLSSTRQKNWPQFRSQPIPNRYPFFSSRFSLLPRPNLQFSALTFSRVFYQFVYTVSVESRRWWSRNVLNIKDLHLGIFEALATQLGSTGQWRPIEISLVSTSFTPWRNISTNRFGCCFYFLEATRPALRAAARPPLS
jgi:hypothetical protein